MLFDSEGSIQSNSTPQTMTNPFGIYIHIPFCVHKCSYCDFYSFTKYGPSDFGYLQSALEQEIGAASQWLRREGRSLGPARSVFIGGGTPSLLSADSLARLLQTLGIEFAIAPDAEITTEANPETLTAEFCKRLRDETPINRISLGAQSFQPKHLGALERLGSRDSIIRASEFLSAAGFENFNLDLIFGIPDQTMEEMMEDIEEAAHLNPSHLSFYNLTLKPGHKLFSKLPSSDVSADLYERGVARLGELGFELYEISNFARDRSYSQHNLLYWDGGDFLGVGPSASSRFFWDGVFHHRKALSDFRTYISESSFPYPAFSPSSHSQTVLEAAFLELRKSIGVSPAQFRARYGYDLQKAKKYPFFIENKLIEFDGNRLRLTARGRMLADSVTADLVD